MLYQLSYRQVDLPGGTRTRDHAIKNRSNPYLHHPPYSESREDRRRFAISTSNPRLHHGPMQITLVQIAQRRK